MKLIKAMLFFIIFLILPGLSFAQSNWKYNTNLHGKTFNAAIIVTFWNGDSINCFQDGFCDELLPVYADKACYNGELNEAIRLLTYSETQAPFGITGSDEEEISKVRAINKKYILVEAHNKVAGTKEDRVINPCN